MRLLQQVPPSRHFGFQFVLCQRESQSGGMQLGFSLSLLKTAHHRLNIFIFMQVFLTHGKGFGVRTREPLKKGTYICDYSGEVLNDISIEARAKKSSDVYLYVFCCMK